ncbi:MAG: hypothetical protein A3H98_14580 [Bacteroidetes bacterium RIFCSPLOWO2_02_FULL_36_8]|nr:MAG: hypothetical protein A3H98_14580 [Bacteroidetes bacterium RIFCSPLOWO2_02_FULL_36_8]OFY72139.1 MAG: hypothetical protein A3G23_07195 [Bacteroidetes bacterium RIFCSPLOWO2_12_FULL_37_12]
MYSRKILILLLPLLFFAEKSIASIPLNNFIPKRDTTRGIRQSLVKIYTFRENKLLHYGTGILLNDSGMVLTHYHLIQSADNMFIKRENHVYAQHEIIGVDVQKDLLLLKFKPIEEEVLTGIPCFSGIKPEETKGWICFLDGERLVRQSSVVHRVNLQNKETELQVTPLNVIPVEINAGILISSTKELMGLVTRKSNGNNGEFVLTLCSVMKGLRKISSTEKDPLNLLNLMDVGKNNYRSRDLNQAVDYFLEVVRKDSNFSEAYYFLGMVYFKLREYGASNYYFEKSLEKSPDNKEAYNMIGINHFFREEYELAEKYALKATSLDYQYPNPYLNLGSIYQKTARESLAIANYQKCLSLKPDVPRAYCNIGIIYENQKKYTEALKYYKKAFDIDSTLSETLVNMGNVYLRQENFNGAIRIYNQALKKGFSHWLIHYNLGVAFYFSEKYQDALKEFTFALATNKEEASIHYFLFLVNDKTNNQKMADKHKRIALAIQPEWKNKSQKEILEEIK